MSTAPPFSYVVYAVSTSGTNQLFSYSSIPLLDETVVAIEDQLKVYRNGVELTVTTEWELAASSQIKVLTNLVTGDTLTIYRDTEKKNKYVDFNSSAFIDQQDLDLAVDQALFTAQEAYDKAFESIHLNATRYAWDAQGLEVSNAAPATQGNSLVTLNQLNAAMQGNVVVAIDGCRIFGFEGDGVEDTYALDGGIPKNVSACQLFVFVNGVLIEPDCASGNPPAP